MLKQVLRAALRIFAGLAVTVSLLVWGVYGWAPIPRICGRIQAQLDVGHGRYRQLGYGLPVPWRQGYESLLRDHYGVQFHAVAACIVTRSQIDFVDAYNEVSVPAANRKFGHDIFSETGEQAFEAWKQAQKDRLKFKNSSPTKGSIMLVY